MKGTNLGKVDLVHAVRGFIAVGVDRILVERQKNGLFAVTPQNKPTNKTSIESVQEGIENVK